MGSETLDSFTTTGITFTAAGAYNSPFSVTTTGTIDASGAYGVYDSNLPAPVLLNQGNITADSDNGLIGVFFEDGGTIANLGHAVILGRFDGVFIKGAVGTVTNAGTINGIGEVGMVMEEGGTVINTGTIAGSLDAVEMGASDNRVVAGNGAVFIGDVQASGTTNTLEFAGTGGTVASIGGQFRNFQTVAFDANSAWTISGDAAALTGLAVITDFAQGDEIDLTGFAATAANYISGTGLVLSNATASETISLAGALGPLGIIGDGAGGTDILVGTYTLSTYSATGITLTNTGPDFSPFTVTTTGTINSGTYGVFSNLSAAYLLNKGSITAGAEGVYFRNSGNVENSGIISAGDIINAVGIYVRNGGTVSNIGRSAVITSGVEGVAIGRSVNPSEVANTGSIKGEDNGVLLSNIGDSAVYNAASYAVIYGGSDGVDIQGEAGTGTVINAGTIIGYQSEGVLLEGGTVSNSGTIIGGVEAVYNQSGAFTLNALAGGVFEGAVADHATSGVLNLAGTTAGRLDMDGSFSGFSSINFGAAAWTLVGTESELAGGQVITGFVAGDTLDITHVIYDRPQLATETLTLGDSDVLTITQDTVTLDVTLSSADTGANFTISADGAGGFLITDDVACFCAGTRIRTPRGEILVEHLATGDEIVTKSGQQPIKWIGKRRLYLSRHLHPETAQPICFEAECLGPKVPARDLYLSPDHALYLDGILVPAKVLVNGANVAQLTLPTVTYYHIELNEHDVIFAENTPAETYLETGNRDAFENGGGAVALHPDFAQTRREAAGCAPFMDSGPQVEAIRRKIISRAEILTTHDPALNIAYRDGHAVIQSRYAIPGLITADPRDRRRLGVKIACIKIGGRDIPIDHPSLVEGWHDVEPDGRWTDGNAVIPAEILSGATNLTVHLAATLPYPLATQHRKNAMCQRADNIFLHR